MVKLSKFLLYSNKKTKKQQQHKKKMNNPTRSLRHWRSTKEGWNEQWHELRKQIVQKNNNNTASKQTLHHTTLPPTPANTHTASHRSRAVQSESLVKIQQRRTSAWGGMRETDWRRRRCRGALFRYWLWILSLVRALISASATLSMSFWKSMPSLTQYTRCYGRVSAILKMSVLSSTPTPLEHSGEYVRALSVPSREELLSGCSLCKKVLHFLLLIIFAKRFIFRSRRTQISAKSLLFKAVLEVKA